MDWSLYDGQWVKVPAAKPGDLSSIPKIQDSQKLSPDLQMCIMACAHIHTHKNVSEKRNLKNPVIDKNYTVIKIINVQKG